ncbi:hypothetical protein [Vibrio navarrensis]|uniref:hypothetical protein n=1 Tax=Vibrio navarrensis TaxID=29495 RepID=UPI00186983CA|nr:hypothetical protein [Vibrio navarrensis]MBE4601476.1 hypothetical protein [Vibrio navarrensis]
MKKLLLASAVSAAAIGAYVYQSGVLTQETNDLLSLIPAESAIVAVQTEAFDHYAYLKSASFGQQQLADEFDGDLTPEQHFLIALFDGYAQSASSPEALRKYLGTAEKINPLFYTIGLIPVYKLTLQDPTAFWHTIDQKEQETGATHKAEKLGNVDFRRYTVADKQEFGIGLDLIIATEGKVLTITLDSPELGSESPLKMALGQEKPTRSLADTDILSALQAKYGKEHNSYAYFDHQALIKGLTTKEGNRIAKQLNVIKQPQDEEVFSLLQTPACQQELATIGSNWPRTVATGQFKYQEGKAVLNGDVIVESNNKTILNALNTIRGFLPSLKTEDASIFSLGFGLEMAKLAPAVGEIWQDLRTPTYSCELLSKFQNGLGTQNPAAMMSMASGMVNGLKGVSFSLYDFKPNFEGEYGPTLDKLDFILSMSASDPKMLLQSAQMFIPELAGVDIPANDQPVDLSELLQDQTGLENPLFARLNDKHFTLYSGEKATSASGEIMPQALNANGLVKFFMDSPRLLELIDLGMQMSGEELPQEVIDAFYSESATTVTLDVDQHGVVFGYGYHNDLNEMKVANEQASQ